MIVNFLTIDTAEDFSWLILIQPAGANVHYRKISNHLTRLHPKRGTKKEEIVNDSKRIYRANRTY